MPPSGGAGFAGAAVCAAGLARTDSARWARERRRLRCRLQAVPALPVPPSAPLAWRAGIQHDGRVTDAARLAELNAAHRALARLEQAGLVRAVITQNIDLLHERAGSRDVVEVHGSIRTSSCPGCGASYPLARVLELLADAEAPACPECGSILKPDVVFFGELLPAAEIDRGFELAREAALMLVVGSALEVHPVAGLPLETLAAGGGGGGGKPRPPA